MSIRNRFTSVLFYYISAEYERGMVKRSELCKVCCHNEKGTLIVIRSECEGSIPVVRKMVKEDKSYQLSAVSCKLTILLRFHSAFHAKTAGQGNLRG